MLWGMIAVCLLFACMTDCRSREVYNVTWWAAGAAAILLLLEERHRLDIRFCAELAFFIALQLTLFTKMYGRADCYAFSVCAVAEAAAGLSLAGYFIHMLLSFILLAFVQALRHNIGRGGNLRRPVPFLPYITLAFWALLWYSVTV
ncbi:MAG: hypothetical protein NC123_09265 [Butyrivibrio sp.]|nr:hypothetical protein [Acetatifactor muris]MCM1559723.1 hypothetical protein [Butyrivibrio sp.]